MKTIIRYLLVSLTVFLTIQCDVRNEQPIPQNIEPNIESTGRVEYVNIIKPYVYKENVYFIDLGTTGKMTFINDKEVVFSGDFTINKGNKKLRMAADEPLPDGSIVYIRDPEKSGQFPPISFEVSGGTSIGINIKYDFYIVDPNFPIESSKTAHKEVFEFDLTGNFSKDIKEIEKYQGSISLQGDAALKIIYTIETIEEVENGKIKSGKRIETTSYDGKLSGILNAKLENKEIKGEVERSLIEVKIFSQELATLIIPGTIITIHPRLEIGFGIKSSIELSGSIDIIKGKKTDIVYYEFIEKGYVEKGTTKQDINYEIMKFTDRLHFNGIKAESSLGFYSTLDTKFNKYLIPLSNTEIALGGYKLTAFWNLKLAYISSEKECSDRLNLTPNIECFFNFYGGSIYDKKTGEASSILGSPIFLDKLSFSFEPYNLSNLICGPITESQTELSNFSFTDFQKFIKDKGFETAVGLTPRNIDGLYTFDPNRLVISNFGQDKLPMTVEEAALTEKFIPFGKVEIEISSNPRKIKIEQYDSKNDKTIVFESTSSFTQDGYALGVIPLITIESNSFSILCALDGEVVGSEEVEYTDYLALTIKDNGISGYVKYRVANRKGEYQKLPVGIYRIFTAKNVTKQPI